MMPTRRQQRFAWTDPHAGCAHHERE